MSVRALTGWVVRCDGCGTTRRSDVIVAAKIGENVEAFRELLEKAGWLLEAGSPSRIGTHTSRLDFCPTCRSGRR